MRRNEPAPSQMPPDPKRRIRVAGVLAITVAITAGLGCQSLAPPSATSSTSSETSSSSTVGPPFGVPRSDERAALGRAGGSVPDGTTVFDDGIPAVANLDRALLQAVRRAATDAARDGVRFVVTSGWRSPAYQERLFRQAVSEYGSEQEAARWVATAETSPHVSGDAIDIGDAEAIAWLSSRGARYGLCQIYRNEPWHYELRAQAIDGGCPPMYADPSRDPRLQP